MHVLASRAAKIDNLTELTEVVRLDARSLAPPSSARPSSRSAYCVLRRALPRQRERPYRNRPGLDNRENFHVYDSSSASDRNAARVHRSRVRPCPGGGHL